MKRPTRAADAPTPGPKRENYESHAAYLDALLEWGEANGGLADDPLELMDIIAEKRIASYAVDEQRRAGEKAAREKGTVVAPGNKRERPS